jgi:hypothetical protein
MATTFYLLTFTTTLSSITCCVEKSNISSVLTKFFISISSESTDELVNGGVFDFTVNSLTSTQINHFAGFDALVAVPSTTTYTIVFTNGSGTITSDDPEGVSTPVTVSSIEGCFNEGTKILCLNNKVEEYVPIEQLRKGDIVKTYHYGYRKIDMIGKNYLMNNPDNFTHCMYKMKKTDTNGLTDDLIITGGHSILVDDLGENKDLNQQLFGEHKIEDKYLLLAGASNNFEKIMGNDKYTYYHFFVENNGNDNEQFGVWANGVLTETTSKNYFIRSHFILI